VSALPSPRSLQPWSSAPAALPIAVVGPAWDASVKASAVCGNTSGEPIMHVDHNTHVLPRPRQIPRPHPSRSPRVGPSMDHDGWPVTPQRQGKHHSHDDGPHEVIPPSHAAATNVTIIP
jgi:hypothetical protein